ncbi:MAG: hypothetical protein Q9199_006896 [Rusavskia elegans]
MAPSSSLSKLKVQLKLSISRLRMVQQKDTAIAKQQRRQMAHLLEQGKEESARIRVENIIRSDITTELLEILELYCELLLARIGLLEPKECDPGLEEAIKSIIHAAPRTDVKELQQARQLLVEKYGKDFALEAVENSDGKVAERVVKKLKVEPPDAVLVDLYLKEIAKTYGVDWPKAQSKRQNGSDEEDDDDPGCGQVVKSLEDPLTTEELTKATPPRDLGPKSPVSIAPPSPSTDNLSPRVKLPGPPELKPTAKTSGLKKQTPNTQSQSEPKGEDANDRGKKGVGGKIPDASTTMPEGKSSWTEAEKVSVTLRHVHKFLRFHKLALMVSIVGSLGATPKWDLVKLPAGRSKMACMHAYRAAMEAAKGVALGDNQNADAVKKRGKKQSGKAPAIKVKRARKNEGRAPAQDSDVSDAEERSVKKVKTEHAEGLEQFNEKEEV